MNMLRSVGSVAVISVGLMGCKTTEEKVVEAGAAPLTKDEVIAHITGNTELWTKRGGYYGPDGVLLVKWSGEAGSGSGKLLRKARFAMLSTSGATSGTVTTT